jgi:dihydroorotate dehydrogenase electron transfer subunit
VQGRNSLHPPKNSAVGANFRSRNGTETYDPTRRKKTLERKIRSGLPEKVLLMVERLVLHNEQVALGYHKLAMDVTADVTNPLPGQFYSIRCGGSTTPLLRRPFSVHRLVEGRSVEFLYRVLGPGTSWLSERQAGDALDILGPLGNGFSMEVEDVTHAVLVARGIGIAPLYALGEAFMKRTPKVRLSFLMGARLKQRLFYRKELEAIGPVYWYTDDGSEGFHGRASHLLEHLLATGVLPLHCVLFACGPISMLRDLAHVALKHSLQGQVALETHMGCGFGACLSCAVPLKRRAIRRNGLWTKPALQWSENGQAVYSLVCKDGPIYDLQEVDWDEWLA